MREVRSVVNALFYFAVFLLLRALFVPGPPGGAAPRASSTWRSGSTARAAITSG